jgi:hypothetical protein
VDALYESGKQALKKLITPTLSYGIDIADLLDIVDCKLEWNKVINLGNIIHVETRKNIVDQRLVGYTHSVGKSLTVDCSNKERLDSPERYLTDSIGQAISGARTVYAKKFMWDLSEQNGDWINNIINNNFDASRYAVVANDQAIRIDERGILLSSMDKSDLNIVRMLNNIIVMSQDGGQTYSLALTGQGIVAEKLIGRILAGTNLVIANEANNVSIDANGFTLKDSQYKTLISPQGVASSDNISFLDSVDADNSLIMDFFIDSLHCAGRISAGLLLCFLPGMQST